MSETWLGVIGAVGLGASLAFLVVTVIGIVQKWKRLK